MEALLTGKSSTNTPASVKIVSNTLDPSLEEFFFIFVINSLVKNSSDLPASPFTEKPKPEPNASLGLEIGFVNCAGPRIRNIPPAEGAYSEGPVKLKKGRLEGSVGLSGKDAICPFTIPFGINGSKFVFSRELTSSFGLIIPKSGGGAFDKAALCFSFC